MKTINAETMLLAWSETSQGGARITLQLADVDDLEPFKAMTLAKGRGKTAVAGQRLMSVFAEIGEDEKPVGETTGERVVRINNSKFPTGFCGLAIKWCQEEDFYWWLQETFPNLKCWQRDEAKPISLQSAEMAAKAAVLEICFITSRKELDLSPVAGKRFHDLILVPYKARLDKENSSE